MNLKEKLAGSIKSKTVWLLTIWQAIILNIDTVQSMLPQVHEYFGDGISSVVNKVFFFLLLYVRLFHTKGTVEDKVQEK